ncbi:hypothetical protein [Phenylobacterium sp.]|nr:hypothetical protein [Phenylobacterium sp.]HVI31700.1 hypothetical protein [Phenylobacterium sp.]
MTAGLLLCGSVAALDPRHAVRRIESVKAEDASIARDLDVLLRKLRG